MKTFALLLILLGISLLIFQACVQKKVPVHKEMINGVPRTGDVAWYMYGGALSMAAGVFILMGRKKEGI